MSKNLRILVLLIFLGAGLGIQSFNNVFAQTAYSARCEHGGYYLTWEHDFQKALDGTFELLEKYPAFKENFEIEPWTLERMKYGEKFLCEKYGREKKTFLSWGTGGSGKYSVEFSSDAAHSGKYGLRIVFESGSYAHACQTLEPKLFAGKEVIFSGWIRQRKGTGAHFYIDAHKVGKIIEDSSKRTEPVPADGNWHKVEIKYTIPEEAEVMYPQARIVSVDSDADFDDISIKDVATGKEILPNGDFEKMVMPTLLDIERLEKIKNFVKKNKIEIIGGAYTQPFLYMLDNESSIRQFTYGMRAVEDAVGAPVKIYAAQEMGMTGQLPQILNLFSFNGVLYRTSWAPGGIPPMKDVEKCWWIGRDGSKIECVPAYTFVSGEYGQDAVPASHFMEESKNSGIERPLFSGIADFITQCLVKKDSPEAKGNFGTGWANICRETPADQAKGKQIKLSCFIRARKPGAHVYIDSYDNSRMNLGGKQSDDAPADGKWHKVVLIYPVKDNAAALYPQARIVTVDGDADFDMIRLTTADGKVITEESFEDGLGGFGITSDKGVTTDYEIVSGDAPDGKNFIRLKMEAESFKAEITTLSDYFKLTGKPMEEWNDAFADFIPYFPFGFLSGKLQYADRKTEDNVLRTERLLAILGLDRKEKLDDAWKLHLLGQHHDPWICAAGAGIFGIWRQKTYEQMGVDAQAEADGICEDLIKEAGGNINVGQTFRSAEEGIYKITGAKFTIVNVAGFRRNEIAKVMIGLPNKLAKNPAIFVENKPAPAEIKIISQYEDGSAKEVEAEFLVEIPGFSTKICEVKEGTSPKVQEVKVDASEEKIVADNGLINVEATKEGVFLSTSGMPAKFPLKLAGNFPGKGNLESNLKLTNYGREGTTVVLSGEGEIGGVPFRNELKISPRSPLLRLSLEFNFGKRTIVGPTENKKEIVPYWAYDEEKLRLVIPLSSAEPKFFAHGPFEVRPTEKMRWPVVRYAIAQDDKNGIAVFTDRVTCGVFHKSPASLEVVIAHGGKVIYSSTGENQAQPLSGKQRWDFRLIPFQGTWESAQIPKWQEISSQPIIAISGATKGISSLVFLEPENEVIVTGLIRNKDGLVVRFWRPYSGKAELKLKVSGAKSLSLANPYGEPVKLISNTNEGSVKINNDQIITIYAKF